MQLAILFSLTLLAASQAAACFAPIRSPADLPLQQAADCSFVGSYVEAGPAYEISPGYVAQSLGSFGACNERYFAGTLLIDCAARLAGTFRNWSVLDFEPGDGYAGPPLPKAIWQKGPHDIAALIDHRRVTEASMHAAWIEKDGSRPDLFCGCAVPALPRNEKG